jgi:hypothetical protein
MAFWMAGKTIFNFYICVPKDLDENTNEAPGDK